MVKNPPVIWETLVHPWLRKIPWRRDQLPTPVFWPGESPWTEEPGRPTVHGAAELDMTESDTTERLHFHALEKEMATHSSVLAWRIPGIGEPGGLPSMGSHRAGHD